MPEKIIIKRDYTETPFGFKLQGGADFSVPLSILQITPNSIADQAGLRPGDVILKLNDIDISSLEHSKAKMEIIRCGNEFSLTVERLILLVDIIRLHLCIKYILN
jgi:S1-C subfamily serine protease